MKRSMRICAMLLMLALLLPACAQSKPNPADTTTAAVDTTAPAAPVEETTTEDPNDRSKIPDSVPEGLSFDGESVRILYRGDGAGEEPIEVYDVVGTDNVGDQLTDAIWERNRAVEERLGIKLECIPGARANSEITALIRRVVTAASDEYDVINSSGNTMIVHGLNPYLRDVSELPYTDFSEPWWWYDSIRALSLDGKSYFFLFGDMNQRNYTQTGAMFYNKNLYNNLFGDPDEPYSFVLNGSWTIDLLREKVAAAYSDANGNGVADDGDVFGLLGLNGQSTQIEHFVAGCDLDLYHYDESGNFIIEFDQERCVAAIDKLISLFYETTGVQLTNTDIDDKGGNLFVEGNYLFFPARLGRVLGELREMDDPFGILPYPKLEESQSEYKSLSHNSGTAVCVPKTVSDEKMKVIGAALESINAESYRSVMPIFLETALKIKYSRDAMSGQVIDILIGSVIKNTLHEYSNYTNSIWTTCLLDPIRNNKNNFASAYAKVLSAAQKTWVKSTAVLAK